MCLGLKSVFVIYKLEATKSMEPADDLMIQICHETNTMLTHVLFNYRVCVLGITLGKLIPQNFVQIL